MKDFSLVNLTTEYCAADICQADSDALQKLVLYACILWRRSINGYKTGTDDDGDQVIDFFTVLFSTCVMHAPRGICLVCFNFFFNDCLETSYLKIHHTDFYQIFINW